MKNITGVVTTTGNVDASNAVECSFSASGLGHIMSILSNMYSNAYKAVLREYSCNARDSHIEAGQTRPIEVTLPSSFQPSLLIQDYGVGLSKDGILGIYGTYGESTKRDTNEQVGAFGIGSKAAFTLGQQFVVTGVKDGRKTVVLFSLNEQNVGTMNVLREADTDEHDGVLISLAVPDPDRMAETAQSFFSTWTPGTVLVNGEQPESVYDTGYSINESVHIIPGRNGVEIIMGAVGYPVSREILRKVSKDLADEGSKAHRIANDLSSWGNNAVYINVEIGDVDIAPSREALRDTPRTISAIKKAVEAIAHDIISGIEEQVNAATTWYEAVKIFDKAKENTKGFSVSLDHIQWQNKPLGDASVDLPHLFWYKKSWRAKKELLGATHKGEKFTLSLSRIEKTMIVTGVPQISSLSRIAKRVMEAKGLRYVLVSEEAEGEFDWFQYGGEHEQVETLTFEEFKALNKSLLAEEKKDRPKNLPSYDTVPGTADPNCRTPLSEILDEGQDILLFEGYSAYSHTWMFDEAMKDRTLIVLLPIQSRRVLERHVNGEVEIIDGLTEIRRIAKEAVDALTEDQRKVHYAQEWLSEYENKGWGFVEKTYGDRLDEILHEEFKEILSQAPAHREIYEAGKDGLDRVLSAARILGSELLTEKVKIPNVNNKFPLLPTRFNYWEDDSKEKNKSIRHGIAYLNGLALS